MDRREQRVLTILGGGPAGLAIAYYAHRRGLPFALYERSVAFGGLCRTHGYGGHRYDSGAHRFHDRDPAITRDVQSLLGDELRSVTAPSQIYERGRFIAFPPTPLSFVLADGVRGAGRIGVELMAARMRRREMTTFADFAMRQFGATLARRLVLDYSEKLWGLPADQLSPDVATRRLQGMTIRSLLAELVLPGRKAAHIDGAFLYPRDGYGRIAERLVESVPAASVYARHDVKRIECRDGTVRRIHFGNGRVIEPEGQVVSTIPLTQLVSLLGTAVPSGARAAAERLRFRHVRIVFLRLAQPSVTPNASIYVPQPDLAACRVSEPRNRSLTMAPTGETGLVVEVPCFRDDRIGALDDDALAARAIDELESIGLIQRGRVLGWRHHMLANAYPVYALDYTGAVREVLSGLSVIRNLDTLGRGGQFFYSHLHDQMRWAREYVGELCAAPVIASRLDVEVPAA